MNNEYLDSNPETFLGNMCTDIKVLIDVGYIALIPNSDIAL